MVCFIIGLVTSEQFISLPYFTTIIDISSFTVATIPLSRQSSALLWIPLVLSISRAIHRSMSVAATVTSSKYRFVDIGANLLNERYTLGEYRGSHRHDPDFDDVLQRAAAIGMRHIILTAGTVQESKDALAKVRQLRAASTTDSCRVYCTIGVHPTRSNELEDDGEVKLQELINLAKDGMTDGVVASVGEMGLDYDRLDFSSKEIQLKWIRKQLRLAHETGLPLFLHNRNVSTDLYDILLEQRDQWTSGVVHSFDDTLELAKKFIDLGLYIGLNGCSLRSKESLAVVKDLPLDRILMETDCPYCDVKRTHAGYHYVKTLFESRQEKKFEKGFQVKGRNEPCNIIQVAEVIAGCKGVHVSDVIDACYRNSLQLYGWEE